jgi:hypothetical protein
MPRREDLRAAGAASTAETIAMGSEISKMGTLDAKGEIIIFIERIAV